jgi:hypothetical protein
MGRYLVRPVVRLFLSRKLGAIEVEHFITGIVIAAASLL